MRLLLLCFLCFLSCRTPSGAVPHSEFQQALEALQANNPHKALPALERLHQQDSNHLEISRALAETYVRLGQTHTLLARLQDDLRPVAHYMRGLLLYSQPATAEKEAIDAFQAAIALAPAEAEFHYRLGIALLELERYAHALEALNAATALAPHKTAWQLPLAKALSRLEQTPQAIAALHASLEGPLSQAEIQTAKQLMALLLEEPVPASAQPALDESIQWLNVADVPQQAVATLEALLLEFPDLATAHALLGLAYQRLDDAGRAMEEFRKAIALAPHNGAHHYYLAELLASKRRPEDAQKEYALAVHKNPFLDNAHLKLGEMAAQNAQWATARQHFQTATRLGNPQARLGLALAFQAEHNWSAAEAEFLGLLQQMPNNVELSLRAGIFYVEYFLAESAAEAKASLRHKALAQLDKVLEAQPENALASRAKAMLHRP